MAQAATISNDPRRTICFSDPQTPNAVIKAREAGIFRADNFSALFNQWAIAALKKKRAACERKNIVLPAAVYAD